ncbi:hypothetical protein [Congregibacter litoralis]|nr:hypothetical protein [Congregibacter litoralis]
MTGQHAGRPGDDGGFRAAMEEWMVAVSELAGDYAALAIFEVRTAVNAAGVFVALNVMFALFVAIAWISAFTAVGLMVIDISATATSVSALTLCASATGAAVSWVLRTVVRDRIGAAIKTGVSTNVRTRENKA